MDMAKTRGSTTNKRSKTTMARTTNGTELHQSSPPQSYVPQVGRPPRKSREPVRTGLLQSLRTMKEIMTNWSQAVAPQEDGSTKLVHADAAKLCGDQIRFLSSKLSQLVPEVEKRIEEG